MKYTIEESNLKESDLEDYEQEEYEEQPKTHLLIWILVFILVAATACLVTFVTLLFVDKPTDEVETVVEDRHIFVTKDIECDVSYELFDNTVLIITIKTNKKIPYNVYIFEVHGEEEDEDSRYIRKIDTVISRDGPDEYIIRFTCDYDYDYIIEVEGIKHPESHN